MPFVSQREHDGFSFVHLTFERAHDWQQSRSFWPVVRGGGTATGVGVAVVAVAVAVAVAAVAVAAVAVTVAVAVAVSRMRRGEVETSTSTSRGAASCFFTAGGTIMAVMATVSLLFA